MIDFKTLPSVVRVSLRKFLPIAVCSLASFAAAQITQILPTVTTVAGNHVVGNTGNGGPATAASLGTGVSSAAYDNYGNLYIADTGNKVIRRVDAATGNISVYAGGGVVCAPAVGTTPGATDTAGYGCPATQAVFQSPVAVRVFHGDLYIVDNTDNRVRKVSLANGIISVVLGTGAGTGTVVYGQPGPQTIVKTPQAIAINSRGDIFVTQNGGAPRVDRVDALTGVVNSFAGNGTGAKLGDGGLSGAAEVNVPIGLAVDSHDNVYIADRANNCIRKVTVTDATATNGVISTYAGPQGTATTSGYQDAATGDLALFGATSLDGIFFDAQDNLYVTDNANGRIRKIAPPTNGQTAIGGVVSSVVGNGIKTGNGNDGQYAVNANLIAPFDVTISPTGDIVITDKQLFAIRMVRPVSVFSSSAIGVTSAAQTVWASTATDGSFTTNGSTEFAVGATTCAAAATPLAGQVCSANVTFKPALSGARIGSIVFTDSASVSVSQPLSGTGVSAAASVLPGIINLSAGSSAGTAGSTGDGLAATSALLSAPNAVATDAAGNTYIADSANHEIRRISVTTGAITRVAGTAGTSGYTGDGGLATSATLHSPSGLAVDGAGNLYIADTANNVIRRVDGVTGVISTIAGTGTAGYTGDGHLAVAATLNGPTDVAFCGTGVLYVADTGNNVVRVIGVRSGMIQAFAGTGTAGFGGDAGPSIAALLTGPTGLAIDNGGALYIADTGNQRLREVDATGLIRTIAGTGIAGYNGDGSATAAYIFSPTGIAVDAAGAVYVADTGNNRIRLIAGGQLSTIAGTGVAGATGNAGNSNAALLKAPGGIALDATNGLIIADTGNNQIRRVDVSVSALAFPETTPATSSASQSVSLLNSGNQLLSISSVTIPAGFAEDASGSTDCNSSALALAAGAACVLQLHFVPTALGPYSGNVVLTDNAQAVSGAKQTVAVSGLGKQVFKFVVSLPASVTAGSPVSVTVTATNPTQTYTGTIAFSSSDGQAVLPASYTFTLAESGVHTFTGITFGTVGIQTFTVTDALDNQQSGTSSTTVAAGPAARVIVQSGSGQSANIATSFASPLIARVLDAYSNPVQGVTVTFIAPTSGPHASFGGSSTTTAVTNAAGLASTAVVLTADSIIGTYTVQVSIAATPTTGAFSLTNTSTVPADFTLTPYQTVVGTVLPGASTSQNITITPVGGFSAAINFTCSASDSSTSCSVNPTSVPGTDGTSQTVRLTFATAGPNRTNGAAIRIGATSTVLAFIGLIFVSDRRRRGLQRAIFGFLAMAVVSIGLSGCTATVLSQPRTASGTYTVTVTGTAGSTSHALTIQYVVGGD